MTDVDSRPALVLVHGAGQGSRMWRGHRSVLADRFRVITPDLPGFGQVSGPFTMADAGTTVRHALEGVGPAFLCGISLGAAVAAQVAAQYPALVDRLILIAPPVAPARTHQCLLTRHRRWPGWLVRLGTDLPDRAAWLTVHAELEATDLTALLPKIGAPTLVLCGQRDRVSLPDARRSAQAIAGARLAVIPHIGHLLPARVLEPIATGFFRTY